jgi:uncharacterized oxidoreductase
VKLTGSTILVAGGTSGIGLGLALRLRNGGNRVIVAGRRRELLKSITSEHGIETVPFDAADPAAIAELRDTVEHDFPETNVVICMAGVMLAEDLTDPSHLAVAEQTIQVNLLGTIRLINAFTPHLIRAKDAAFMTVTSGLAFVPLPITPTYNATKAAIHSFTQSLRVQLAPYDVEVVELVPPGVRTTLFGQDEAESGMLLDEFLDEVMELLAVEPPLEELCVTNVHYFRYAESRGEHSDVLRALSGG